MINDKTKLLKTIKPLDLSKDRLLKIFEEHYTSSYFFDGNEGLKKFIIDFISKDEQGKDVYICVDDINDIYCFHNGKKVYEDKNFLFISKILEPYVIKKGTEFLDTDEFEKRFMDELLIGLNDPKTYLRNNKIII